MTINLEDAVRGVTEKIAIPALESCSACDGSGASEGSEPITCNSCGGAGQVRIQQGFFSVAQTCGNCSGSGQIISNPCKDCRGQGRVEKRKTLSVKIPAGVDTGDRIRLSGEGEAGVNGGPSGDLFVQIKVLPHDVFERDGKHLYCEAPITFIDATLGGEIQIPTLDGKVKIKIPEGTQTGKLFRLRGKGISPIRGGSTGDLLCRAVIETPQNLSKQQKQLLKDFQGSFSGDSRQNPLKEEWFSKVKSFFDTKN
jgi:molecular chaperone DnaJ